MATDLYKDSLLLLKWDVPTRTLREVVTEFSDALLDHLYEAAKRARETNDPRRRERAGIVIRVIHDVWTDRCDLG